MKTLGISPLHTRIGRVIACLAMSAAMAQAAPASPLEDAQVDAARRVMSARKRVHTTFEACEMTYRAGGLDSRFFLEFWDVMRFEIFSGAAATLERTKTVDAGEGSVAMPPSRVTAVSPAVCLGLVTSEEPGYYAIEGVTSGELQLMRDAYAATQPDPHIARDRRLYNDCMRANFNVRQMNFHAARFACECNVGVMRSLPQDQFDGWLEQERNGAPEPMQEQPWFEAAWPKMQACFALTSDATDQSTQKSPQEVPRR